MHSSAPSLLLSLGHNPRFGKHNSRLGAGGTSSELGGYGPEIAPRGTGPALASDFFEVLASKVVSSTSPLLNRCEFLQDTPSTKHSCCNQ